MTATDEAKASAATATAPRREPVEPPVDLKDRDPYGMNQHLRLVFSDIIGEPEPGTFSFDRVWILSYQTFTSTKLWCYRILTLLCAIPAAICWGMHFACLSFCNIWCFVPCIKACNIKMACLQKIYGAIMGAFIGPLFDAIGRCLGHIRVTTIKSTHEEPPHLHVHEKGIHMA